MKRKNQFRDGSVKLQKNPKDFKITKLNSQETLFEFGEIITTDLAEAISILMRESEMVNDIIWKTVISENIELIEPRKALYWLSGGDREWITLENFNRNWIECEWDFQEEFGFTIIEIVKKSKTYDDIRKLFQKKLSLAILYEFALRKNFVR
jgi:hypothetical protein